MKSFTFTFLFFLISFSSLQAMVALRTGEKVPQDVFVQTWKKLKKIGTNNAVNEGFHLDLCAIADGKEVILPAPRIEIFKNYGLPTHSADMSADEKKIILASRQWFIEHIPSWGADFVHPVSGEVISSFTEFFITG